MPKLTYFQVHGRAAGIRFLLKHAGVEFVEENPNFDGCKPWAELKAELPQNGQLPWYTDDNGKVWNQSVAILRALAA